MEGDLPFTIFHIRAAFDYRSSDILQKAALML
jgi:hypothetical protein